MIDFHTCLNTIISLGQSTQFAKMFAALFLNTFLFRELLLLSGNLFQSMAPLNLKSCHAIVVYPLYNY